MEQLQQVLRQKFWILLGVGVIVAFTGWYMSVSAMATTITARKSTLDGLDKKLTASNTPSKDFTDKLKVVNANQVEQVAAANLSLWLNQYRSMKWPKDVEPYVLQAGYRGKLDRIALDQYRLSYPYEVKRVKDVARPLDVSTGTGLLVLPDDKSLGFSVFDDRLPDSDEIWDAQEELWLLEAMFERLAAINGGDQAQSRLDAIVHVVERLVLLGGQRKDGKPVGGGGAASPSMGPAGPGGFGAMTGMPPTMAPGGPSGVGGGGMGSGGGAATAISTPSVEFNPTEELGDAPPATSSNQPTGGAGFAQQRVALRRYVEDEPNLPYRTRGFYLVVLMDHRKLPEFLVELTSNGKSPWPIEVLRVHMARLNDDSLEGNPASGSFTGGGFAGAGPAGFQGGGAPGFPSGGSPGFPSGGSPGFPSGGSPGFPSGGSPGGHGGRPGGGAFPGGGFPGADIAGGAGPSGSAVAGSIKNQAASQALQAALADPYIARVAICGLITLYKPPKDWKPEDPSQQSPEAITAPPSDTPGEDPAATEAVGTDGAAAEPAAGEDVAMPGTADDAAVQPSAAPPAATDGDAGTGLPGSPPDGDAPEGTAPGSTGEPAPSPDGETPETTGPPGSN